MIQCMILGCLSTKDSTDESPEVLFFEFPQDPQVRQKWCNSIEAFQGPLTEFGKVCERHFQPDEFVANQFLTPDAVPTLFETGSRPSGNKTFLEFINVCILRDGSGQVRCRLQEDGVPCGFSLEKFESRALLQHICETHSALAGIYGFPGVKRSVNSKPVAQNKFGQLTKKVLNHVSLEPDGYHCRIEDSTCLYFHPNMHAANFARHFRDMHPMKAFDNGYFDGFRSEDICLNKRVKFKNRMLKIKTMVRSKVLYDGTRYRCRISRSPCNYSIKVFNTAKIRNHFCEEHPTEANQCRLLKTKRLNQPNSENFHSGQESLSFKYVQLVEANVVRTRNGIVRCRINGRDCNYKQRKYVPANFYCHFCINHPVEARAKGFFANETENDENLSEREPTPVSMEIQDEPQQSDYEVDDLRLTTPSDNPSTYCRLCFSIAQPLRPIFTGPEDDIDEGGLVELISNCTNIRLCARTDFPSSICYECQQKLDDIQRFRQLCETLDTVVRRQGRMKRDVSLESDEEPEVAPVSNAALQIETITSREDDGDDLTVTPEETKMTEINIRGQTYFKCTNCGFLALCKDNVKRHWARFHRGRNNSTAKMACPLTGCSEFFFTLKSRQYHMQIVHCSTAKVSRLKPLPDGVNLDELYVKLEENRFACRNCGMLYPSILAVVDHFRQNHRRLKYYQKNKPPREDSVDNVCQDVVFNGVTYFKCRDCEVLMTKKSDVAVHWLMQHDTGGKDGQ